MSVSNVLNSGGFIELLGEMLVSFSFSLDFSVTTVSGI